STRGTFAPGAECCGTVPRKPGRAGRARDKASCGGLRSPSRSSAQASTRRARLPASSRCREEASANKYDCRPATPPPEFPNASDSSRPRDRRWSTSVGCRIAAIGWIGNHFLEGGAHGEVQVDAFGRNRLLEPFVVDRINLATLVDGRHGGIDHL